MSILLKASVSMYGNYTAFSNGKGFTKVDLNDKNKYNKTIGKIKSDSEEIRGSLGEIRDLMNEIGIPAEREGEARLAILSCLKDFRENNHCASVPDKPKREFQPRKDNIIEYLKSPDGFGPWTEINALTRPLLGKLSPKAYVALANWLRHEDNILENVGLNIPKKSEMIAQSGITADTIKVAQRIARRSERSQVGVPAPNGN